MAAEGPDSNAPDVRALLTATREALLENRMAAAMDTAAAILNAPWGLGHLTRLFVQSEQIEPLVQLIWDRRDSTLRRYSAIANFMQLSDFLKDAESRIRELRSWLFADSTPPASFTFPDFPYLMTDIYNRRIPRRQMSSQRLRDLFFLKYRGWKDQPLSESVGALAGRFEVPPALTELLYARRSRREIELPTWLQDFKSAQVMSHALRESPLAAMLQREAIGPDRLFLGRFRARTDLSKHVDMTQTRRVFRALDTSRGLVLCTFHGAFLFILYELYRQFMPDHCSLAEAQIRKGNASVEQNDRRSAAFRAVKILMERKAVLIGPDGPFAEDSTSAEIKVFGLPQRISFSAALFAYEARCEVGWCSMVYENERFVPVYVPGPTRRQGETFAQFRDRWLSFYSAQIEAVLSSSPKNLALHARRWFSLGTSQNW